MPTRKPSKPNKPYQDFPLFAHASGQWAKKIRGRLWYFGKWDLPDEALRRYLDERDTIHAGRDPRRLGTGVVEPENGCSVRDVVNHFLTARKAEVEIGNLAPLTFKEYHRTCEHIVRAFGSDTLASRLKPVDFTMMKKQFPPTWGPVVTGNEIGRVRTVFKFAADEELIPHPLNFGSAFRRTGKKQQRIHRQRQQARRGILLFKPNEIRSAIDGAGQPLRACILLGINAGMGNMDCGALTEHVVDFERGWVDFPRPKTGIERRFPLWPETAAAIRDAMCKRPIAKDDTHDKLCFLSSHGKPLVWDRLRDDGRYFKVDNITRSFGKLLRSLGIKREGLNFYTLRRTFETIGGQSRDQVAVDFIMGHADESMAAVYRQGIEDDRLLAVTDHVRRWLFDAIAMPEYRSRSLPGSAMRSD